MKAAVGDRARPFNALYWNVIARHHDRFAQNNRTARRCAPWNAWTRPVSRAIRARAAAFLAAMDAGEEV